MKAKRMISIVAALVLLAVLLNLGRFGVLDAEASGELNATLGRLFSFGGEGLTAARVVTALICVVGVWLVCTVLSLIVVQFRRSNRGVTVTELLLSLIKYVGVIVALVWALAALGVNTTAVLASLGVVSLILGFGAQSLIEDVITGIFIIFEGQYNVGDVIVLDNFRGTVRKIGVRTTCIEDDGGNMKIVNNSDIRNLQNRSKNNSIAVSDIGVEYDADIDAIAALLKENLPKIQALHPELYLDVPEYKGVQELADSAVVLRVIAHCSEPNVFAARRQLNHDLLVIFQKNGVNIPFPQVTLSQRGRA